MGEYPYHSHCSELSPWDLPQTPRQAAVEMLENAVLVLSAFAAPAGPILEEMRDSTRADQISQTGTDFWMRVAELPVDWKAVGYFASAFIVTHTVRQLKKQFKPFGRTKSNEQIDGSHVAAKRWIGHIASTVAVGAGGYLAYKHGEQQSTASDFAEGLFATSIAVTDLTFTRFRANRRKNKRIEQSRRYSTLSVDYNDSPVQY